MSGGFFDYGQYRFEDIARSIDEEVTTNQLELDDDILKRFRETAHTVRQAADMVQRVDWLLSGDDGDDCFRSRWLKEVRGYWHE